MEIKKTKEFAKQWIENGGIEGTLDKMCSMLETLNKSAKK